MLWGVIAERIVIQQRIDNSLSFNRSWSDYVSGFGTPDGNYWMGLEPLYGLMSVCPRKLRVDIEYVSGEQVYQKYVSVMIGSAETFYELNIGPHYGTAGNTLTNGMKFSTYDEDNDITTKNCASTHGGGFWFSGCGASNINGILLSSHEVTGAYWFRFGIAIRRAKMSLSICN